MNRVTEIIQTILPVVVVLLTGILCRRKNLISREGINALKNVVVNITLPAVLLAAFATTTYTFMDIVIPVLMFFICLAAWAMGKAAKGFLKMESRFVPGAAPDVQGTVCYGVSSPPDCITQAAPHASASHFLLCDAML